ncbi:MAG: hypothetical protein L6R37_007602 [Teloschistes peruensis]|nr:MAG: hypothetical protein L6R37_007602 [Teloschistes peruensis]
MSVDVRPSNFDLFRECLSGRLVQRSTLDNAQTTRRRKSKGRKKEIKPVEDGLDKTAPQAEELSEFIDYLASEIFQSLAEELQCLSHSVFHSDARVSERFRDPLPPNTVEQVFAVIPVSVAESLEAYGLLEDQGDLPKFLLPVFQDYVNTAIAAPPVWSSTRTSACEICERDWIPLSYHHLIPRQMHAKAIKRGWHEEWRLNSVAWLCRACHSFLHRIASNEELAREYWTVKRLLEREDVIAWASWVGRVRWKAK